MTQAKRDWSTLTPVISEKTAQYLEKSIAEGRKRWKIRYDPRTV